METVDRNVYRDFLAYDLKCFCHAQERLSESALNFALDGFDIDVFLMAKSSFFERLQSDIHLLGGMAGEW
jgi:hypothetical protein